MKNIRIKDMAVNPLSKKIYFAVEYMDGTPLILTVEGDKIQSVTERNLFQLSINR